MWASLTHQYTWWGVGNEMYRKRVCLFVGWFGTGLFISQPGCERREGDGEREDEGVWGGTRLVRQQVGNPGQWLHGSKGRSRAAECMCFWKTDILHNIIDQHFWRSNASRKYEKCKVMRFSPSMFYTWCSFEHRIEKITHDETAGLHFNTHQSPHSRYLIWLWRQLDYH